MTCSQCRHEFCWICLEDMTHGYGGLCRNENDAKKRGRAAYLKNFDIDQKEMKKKIKAIKNTVQKPILNIFDDNKKA